MNKTSKRKALGRGLSNLIPVHNENNDQNDIHQVTISSVRTNPYQPRIDFDDDEIKGLAESIKNQGLLQPVVVRKKNDVYEIISGERRFRAFKYLKKDTVPCIVKTSVTDREMLELALIENIQREELNEIEKALAYQKLLLEYNYTHEALASHIGKSRTAITNALRLLNLPEEVQKALRNNNISMGHARALLSVDSTQQIAVLSRIINDKLNVRDVENLGNAESKRKISKNKEKKKPRSLESDPNIQHVIDQLQYKFGTSVEIASNDKKKGKISFVFLGNDDLSRIVDILLK